MKFPAVMNMMAPMHENSYIDHVKAICNGVNRHLVRMVNC